jgi:hypothetical protein
VAYATHGRRDGLLGRHLLRLLQRLLSLLCRRLNHLHQRLLRHVAFMLEGVHLVLRMYAGHLRDHDLDLLVELLREAS